MILVLWAAQFEETAATILVSELRNAGLRVKVVGLHGQPIAGAYGLVLGPDIYLDEALRLAGQTRCLVIPAPLRSLAQFDYDPRLGHLLERARAGRARIVAAVDGSVGAEEALQPPFPTLETYLPGESLFEFARNLAKSL